LLDEKFGFLSGSLRRVLDYVVYFFFVAVAPVETVNNVENSGGTSRRPKFRHLLKVCGIGGLAFKA